MTLRSAPWLRFAVLLALAAGVIVLYAAVSARVEGPGFPLDDAWIHQTYARNLVQLGEWAFQPGAPSAGSTAPLWTVLLAVGYALHLEPWAWAWVLGALLLAANAWVCWTWLARRSEAVARWSWLAGVLVVLEWHLVWAAASGMETLALALVVCTTLYGLDVGWPGVALGALVGIGIWIRPDAAILLAPTAWVLAVRARGRWQEAIRPAAMAAVGLAVVVVPYLLFNLRLSGEWWPSTYYAKQAEYASMLGAPLIRRMGSLFAVGLVGAGAVLAPGVVLSAWKDLKERQWARLAPLGWWIAFLTAYALRLPVTYQHGRYAMPAIPVFIVLGAEGLLTWFPAAANRWQRLLGRAWFGASLSVALAFLILGARAYAQDVAIIQTEMVASARWIAENTGPESLVAAHDIGALGYFGNRRLVDMAGLVSPEVIPFLRDEARLAAYLDERRADYLMTFPGWYPALVQQADRVFTTGAPYSPEAGGENMAVYRWRGALVSLPTSPVLYSPQSFPGR